MNTLAIQLQPIPPRTISGWFARLRATAIGRALLASGLVHVLLFTFVPDFRNALPSLPLPDRIDVLLKPRADVAAPIPEPQAERPVPRQQPTPQPQLQRRAESPRPPARETEQRIISATPESPAPSAAVTEPLRSLEPAAPPEVFKAAPAPTPVEPVRPPQPVAEGPSDGMIAAYGNGFKASVDKNRRYPRIALDRGWQGTALILVKVLPGGRLGDVSILRTSGFDLLDDTAREMVKGAAMPAMPDALRAHGFEMRIPVEFRLV